MHETPLKARHLQRKVTPQFMDQEEQHYELAVALRHFDGVARRCCRR
jgi:hypothetical protein